MNRLITRSFLTSFVAMHCTHANNPFDMNPATNIFSPPPAGGGGAQAQQTPPVVPVQSAAVPGTTVEGVVQSTTDNNTNFDQTPAATGGESPMDTWKDLFDNDKQDKEGGDKNANNEPDILSTSMADYDTVSGKIDFTAGLDLEKAKGILENNDVAGLMELLNAVGQKAFAQSSYSSSQVTKAALDSRMTGLKDNVIPDMLRSSQTSNHGANTVPDLNHTAVAPMITALQQQFLKSNPTATPEHINTEIRKYLVEVGKLAAGPESSNLDSEKDNVGANDWSDYFS